VFSPCGSTRANLTHYKPEEVEAIRLALKYKEDLGRILASAVEGGPELKQGPSVGAVWLLSQLARELGVVAALGSDRQGKLALWQIIARVLDQGVGSHFGVTIQFEQYQCLMRSHFG
jgi:hypothetical protein